jgi:hypothetical protein
MDQFVVPFLLDSEIPFVQYCWRNQDDIGNVKFAVAQQILQRTTLDMWFSEMDVFWTPGVSPLNVDTAAFDVAVSAHSYHPEINLGIWAIKSSAVSKDFMNTILIYALGNPGYSRWIGTADQKLFDAVLRGPSNPTVQYRFPNLKHVSLRWKYLEFHQFYHNMEWNFEDNAQRVMTHISFGIVKPEQRIEFVKTWLLWQDPSYNRNVATISWLPYKTFDYKSMLIKALWFGHLLNRTILFPTMFPPIEIDRLACNFDYRPSTFYDQRPPTATARILISESTLHSATCIVRHSNLFVLGLPSKFDAHHVLQSISKCPRILNSQHWVFVSNKGEANIQQLSPTFLQKLRWSQLAN